MGGFATVSLSFDIKVYKISSFAQNQAAQILTLTKGITMKKHKILYTIVTLTLLVATFAPVTAHAYSGDHFFTFNSDLLVGEIQTEPTYQKEDTEQVWVIQLYQTESSNMSASNVFSPKMNRKDLNNVDYWHTFSNYVPPYAIPYQTVVSAVDRMYLTMKRGSHSSSASSLYLTGAYNP